MKTILILNIFALSNLTIVWARNSCVKMHSSSLISLPLTSFPRVVPSRFLSKRETASCLTLMLINISIRPIILNIS